MIELLVNPKTAKLAKNKGFNWETQYEWLDSSHGYFDDDEHGIHPSNRDYGDMGFDIILKMPTQSLLQKWLRDEYKIFVYVVPVDSWDEYKYIILCEDIMQPFYIHEDSEICRNTFKYYEEALEVGLFESLKIIDNE